MSVPPASRTTRGGVTVRRGLRYVGALLVLGIGAIHLQQYFGVYYRVIPVIGPLFAANFAVAMVLGLALLSPLGRIPRFGRPLLWLVALGASGFALTTIVGLEISEFSTLFGFHEHGYRATIDISLAFEAATVVLLGLFLALDLRAARPGRNVQPSPGHQPIAGSPPGQKGGNNP